MAKFVNAAITGVSLAAIAPGCGTAAALRL